MSIHFNVVELVWVHVNFEFQVIMPYIEDPDVVPRLREIIQLCEEIRAPAIRCLICAGPEAPKKTRHKGKGMRWNDDSTAWKCWVRLLRWCRATGTKCWGSGFVERLAERGAAICASSVVSAKSSALQNLRAAAKHGLALAMWSSHWIQALKIFKDERDLGRAVVKIIISSSATPRASGHPAKPSTSTTSRLHRAS